MGRTLRDWTDIYPTHTNATADPDSDGLDNFAEYALASHPGVATERKSAASNPCQN